MRDRRNPRPTSDDLDTLARAVLSLPETCPLHGPLTDHTTPCCDSGRPALYRRQAVTVLAKLGAHR